MHILCKWLSILFLNGLSSCIFLYEWLPSLLNWLLSMHISVQITTISFWMDCLHARFCTNYSHFFLNGCSSCTFLCEWLPFLLDWVFVMHVSMQMTTISFWMDFRHAHFFMNDYYLVVFGFSSCTFLCKWLSISFVYRFSSCTFLCESLSILFWFFHVCNALQCMNSMLQWQIMNEIIMHIGFLPCA